MASNSGETIQRITYIQQEEESNSFLSQAQKDSPNISIQKSSSSKLSAKLFLALAIIVIFLLFNHFQTEKQQSYYNGSSITMQPQLCPQNQFLFLSSCLITCPQNYVENVTTKLCYPKSIDPSQVNLTYIADGSKAQMIMMTISSQDFIPSENRQEEYKRSGIIFFNDYGNGDNNIILHGLSDKYLHRFLDSLNGIIIIFSGADLFYLSQLQLLKDKILLLPTQYPVVEDWYVCGFGFSGGFSALKFTLSLPIQFRASFLFEPMESLVQIKEAQALVDKLITTQPEEVKLEETIKKSTFLLKQNIFLFNNQYHKMEKTKVLFNTVSQHHTFKKYQFFENNFLNQEVRNSLLEQNLLPFIEYYLHTLKREVIDDLD